MGDDGAINAPAVWPQLICDWPSAAPDPAPAPGLTGLGSSRRPWPRSSTCSDCAVGPAVTRAVLFVTTVRTFPKVAGGYFSANLVNTIVKSLTRSNNARWRKRLAQDSVRHRGIKSPQSWMRCSILRSDFFCVVAAWSAPYLKISTECKTERV